MEKIKIRGVKYVKEHFEAFTFSKFKELYQYQLPYRSMRPIDRDKALAEDWKQLDPKKKPALKSEKD